MVMETRSARRKKLVNRIDDLPDNILHDILLLLPIKSAAQTVVLSRRWEKVFISIPDLDFTTLISSPNNRDIAMKYVLSHRDKNSSVKTLKLESDLSSMSLSSLLDYAISYKVQELDLVLPTQFHRNGFSWKKLMENQSLKVLCLGSLYLSFSLNRYLLMNGTFKSLQSLTISNTSFIYPNSAHIFANSTFPCLKRLMMVSCFGQKGLTINCNELTDLVLMQCYGLNTLDIFGLKLERMKVDTCFTISHITNSKIKIIAPVIKYLKWVNNEIIHIPVLEKSSLLEKAVIGFIYPDDDCTHYINGPQHFSWIDRLFNVIIALSHVKTLKFHDPFTDILSSYDLKNIVANKFVSLRQLEISCQVKQFSLCNIQGVTTLLKHTPHIDTLIIKVSQVQQYILDSMGDKKWEDEIPEIIYFLNHVKMVKLVGFLEYVEELCSFVKFLLEHGKVLENITLYLGRSNSRQTRQKRIKSIMGLSWASSKVMKAVEKCRYFIFAKSYTYKMLPRLVV